MAFACVASLPFRAVLLSAAAGILPACTGDPQPIRWGRWGPTYPPDVEVPLEEKARRIEAELEQWHLTAEGVLVYRRPSPAEGLHGDPEIYYDNLADETLFTGILAAVRVFQFRATGDPRDRDLLRLSLGGVKLLHDVTGVPGLFARAVHPASRPVRSEAPGQKWRDGAPPHERFRYRGDVSKDQYFGVLFAYAAAAVELGIDSERGDPEIRELIRGTVSAVADHIWENDLNIIDADGERTEHGDLGGYFLGLVPIGPNAQLSLGFQLLAHRFSGEPRYLARYEELLCRGYAEATGMVKIEVFGKTNHNNDNMGMMGYYALANLESRPEVRSIYERGLEKLWSQTRHEGNSFFHAVYATRFDLPPFAAFDLYENLRLYPTDLRVFAVDLTEHPLAERSFFTNRFGMPKNSTALPLHLRPMSSFVWTRCPFALRHEVGGPPGATRVSGVDYLLAYWMAGCHAGA